MSGYLVNIWSTVSTRVTGYTVRVSYSNPTNPVQLVMFGICILLHQKALKVAILFINVVCN